MRGAYKQLRVAKLRGRKCSMRVGGFGYFVLADILLFVVVGLCAPVEAQNSNPSTTTQPSSQTSTQTAKTENWGQVVRETINHELDAQANDGSLWCYRKLEEEDGKQQKTYVVCQAKGAEIQRLVAIDGRELDEQERSEENERIEHLLKSKREQEKQARRQHEDAKQAADLMKLLADAFVFRVAKRENDRITLNFAPNPEFHPSGNEAQVFHHMEGTLTLDLKQQRLAEISGRLNSSVKFGGGLLGHLDKGGTFLVRQQAIAPGCWQMTLLDVQMNGKALFFKTIAVRQKEIDTQFQPVPPSTTLEQVADMTKEKITEAVARN